MCFLGAVERAEILRLMNECLGIIIPSVPFCGVVEATSIAALEGMSVGKPVFASNIGGLAELIEEGLTGFLFPAGDAEALAALLRLAVQDGKKCEAVGKSAREYVLKNHSLEVWVEKVMEVYRHTLQAR